MQDIHTKAETGIYEIRGYGALRQRRWATFDDLTFLPCGLTRIPLEGYREKCSTKTVLGGRFAKRPLELEIPIMITGMSWGALSYNAKAALGQSGGQGQARRIRPATAASPQPSANLPRTMCTKCCPPATASTCMICAGPAPSN